MFGIIRKDAPLFALYSVPVFGLLLAYQASEGVLDPFAVVATGFFIVLVTWGGISTTEQSEVRSDGYAFLRTLPVTDRQIVAAKFALVFGTAFACLAAAQALLYVLDIRGMGRPLASLYLFCCAVAALLLGGLGYVAIYAWGFPRVLKLAWLSCAAVGGSWILFDVLFIRNRRLDFRGVTWLSQGLSWLLSVMVVSAGLAAFYGLMRLAVRIKARRED